MSENAQKWKVIVVTIMDEFFTVARGLDSEQEAKRIARITERDGFNVESQLTNRGDVVCFQPTSIYKIIIRSYPKDDKCA